MTPEDPEHAADAPLVRPLLQRMTGALQLHASVYDEVAADPEATNQAAIVVALAAIAQSFGGPEPIAIADLPIALAWAYFGWLVPGTLVWIVGSRILKFTADLPRVLRCGGFATTPQILWVMGFLAGGSEPFFLALGVLVFGLTLVANVIGIRQAFAVTTLQAVQTFLLGFIAFAGVALILGFLFAQFDTPIEG